MPSFVPDWRNAHTINQPPMSDRFPSGREYPRYNFSPNLWQLEITGFTFDTVADICKANAIDDDHEMLNWRDMALSSSTTYPTGQSPHWALFSTMTGRLKPPITATSSGQEDVADRLALVAGFMQKGGKAAISTGRVSDIYRTRAAELAELEIMPNCLEWFPAWTGDVPDDLAQFTDAQIYGPMGPAIETSLKQEVRYQLNRTLSTYNCRQIFARLFEKTRKHRRFVITSKGYYGLVPAMAHVGDCICLIHGCNAPLVLREVDDHYVLVEACYVYGVMDGEIGMKARDVNERFILH